MVITKRLMIIGITGIVIIFCGISSTYATLDYQEMYQSSTGSQNVLLVVNSDIYEPVASSLSQYIKDLEAEDYNVTVAKFISGAPDDLKSYMKDIPGLKGVILIGDLPVAKFKIYHPYVCIFPTDFFYMDLNGEWVDGDNDGFYDDTMGNSAGPEIWAGRLPAHLVTRTDMDEVGLLRNYFAKNHSYRTGKLSVPHRALRYSEFGYSPSSEPTLKGVYSDLTIWTVDYQPIFSVYKDKLKQGYEWIHLVAHGGGGFHALCSGIVSSYDIRDIDPKTHFYSLDSCHCCNFTGRDYIGMYYIFSKTNGLAAVGYTKASSFRPDFENFYHNLNRTKRKSIGEAFQNWLNYVDTICRLGLTQFSNYPEENYDMKDYFDKTVLGDPTLSVDPPIASIDYISPSSVKIGNGVTFRGSGKINSGNITAYSWRSSIDGHLSNYSSFSTRSLSPGGHIIYFKVKDNNGRWSSEVTKNIAVGEIVFNLELASGWNLISLPVEPYDTNLVTVLKPIEGLYNIVTCYEGTYDTTLPPVFSSLKTMEHGKGYQIKMGKEAILPIAGKQISNTAIQLLAGWNMVGYNSPTAQPLGEAISSIAGLCEAVIGEFGAYNSAYPSHSSLKSMKPGEGYFIKVKRDCIWDIASSETPWQDNENGALRTNIRWNYTMGYRFTPLKDGKVTKLGGFFNGTKTVYLWNSSQQVLASAQVSSSNNWNYTSITPVQVKAGQTYTVAVYLKGSGGSYRYSIARLPQTYRNIKIETSCYMPGSGCPTYTYSRAMYGQVDIKFVAE